MRIFSKLIVGSLFLGSLYAHADLNLRCMCHRFVAKGEFKTETYNIYVWDARGVHCFPMRHFSEILKNFPLEDRWEIGIHRLLSLAKSEVEKKNDVEICDFGKETYKYSQLIDLIHTLSDKCKKEENLDLAGCRLVPWIDDNHFKPIQKKNN